MNEQLSLLTELQKLDTIILSARMKIDSLPEKISSREVPLIKAGASYEDAKQSHAALEKKKKDKERDIEDANEKIKKLKQRTSEIKSNKEYQAHLKEIERAEKDLKSAEDESLSIMESIEKSSRLLEAEHARISEEKAKIDIIKQELEREASQYREELKKLKEDRIKITDRLESDIYGQYIAIMKACRGLAVVEAKNEICMGCNLHIPPQMFVELKSNDKITYCPQCRRILYYVTPEVAATEQKA